MVARASATDLPLTAADIIDADDWLMEHPWPPMRRSWTRLSATSRYTMISSPHNGLNPSTRTAGGAGSSPRFRGLR